MVPNHKNPPLSCIISYMSFSCKEGRLSNRVNRISETWAPTRKGENIKRKRSQFLNTSAHESAAKIRRNSVPDRDKFSLSNQRVRTSQVSEMDKVLAG